VQQWGPAQVLDVAVRWALGQSAPWEGALVTWFRSRASAMLDVLLRQRDVRPFGAAVTHRFTGACRSRRGRAQGLWRALGQRAARWWARPSRGRFGSGTRGFPLPRGLRARLTHQVDGLRLVAAVRRFRGSEPPRPAVKAPSDWLATRQSGLPTGGLRPGRERQKGQSL
jgi:hypothetical protein